MTRFELIYTTTRWGVRLNRATTASYLQGLMHGHAMGAAQIPLDLAT